MSVPKPAAGAGTRVHGTLVDVDGVGALLLGRSGIGKSECAMELVRRGHRLVADDVVLIHLEEGTPVGTSPELIRHYVELRGIGIVHVPSLFGDAAVADSVEVELVVKLQPWGDGEVERVGLTRPQVTLGPTDFPCVHLPIAPGRNVATLIEVATRNFRLQGAGKSAPNQLDDRVSASLRREGS